ncbi:MULTISPECIES: GntR family transcriptional regulator [unclassified Paenibacillus]|uniref:GntR family transcriptional regulator n=1 Tax=unclassified Paenibacillus TaxID=185978 RepID=UPI0024070309|nr:MULTISPECIES: GntR family transcriptional regulator [unclassified Paenibacillus]MDF9841676.1 DNA-binding GntR family transcriptional regulator [Paenibacillus sp. PastF-2]MDF9848212.1 DNA-binding GntR family transcriptional regulator [Paenibacillus sp. PastM-2]MDF9854835.1 DNA-binding GntR family transcriptional regulator [Paenibacillus sp. PastF-1]MDH6480105.1 DNA-binding GntR family transcriptional regulator [Paenibacillus sp. PastH-2]MDH6507537.1 DNA-binding GntR family transcriptional re
MLPQDTAKVKRSSIREQVYLQIQEWIINGVLKPGDKLKDQELAEALGASRTPIREALLRLEEEGMIQSKANSWTQVTPVDVNQAYRLYPMIISLEKLAVSFAKDHVTSAHIREMEQYNEQLEQALNTEDALEAQRLDTLFHQVLISLSANEELISVLDGLKKKLRRYEVTYFKGFTGAGQSVEEHRQIISALRAGDFTAAAAGIERNWQESFKRRLGGQALDA